MLLKILLFFLFFLPFQWALNPLEGVDLIWGRLLVLFLLLFWLIQSLLKKKIFLRWDKQFFFFFSFIISIFLSLFFTSNLSWSWRKIFFLFSWIPLYFIINHLVIFDKKNNEKILKAIVLGSGLSAMIGIGQFFMQFLLGLDKWLIFWRKISVFFLGKNFGESVLEYSSWLVNIKGETIFRAIAFFPDPHIAGFYWEMTFFLAGVLFLTTHKKIYGGITLMIFLALILTFSRGAYFGFLGSLFLFFLINVLKIKKDYYKNLFFQKKKPWLSFLAIVLILLLISPLNHRLISSFNLSEGSNAERLYNWQQAIKIIKNYGGWGVGIGNYSLSVKPSASYREPIYAHNLYFDIWSELGIIGIISWTGIIISSFLINYNKFFKNNNLIALGVLLSLVAFSFHSFFETALYSVHIFPLLLVLLAIS